MSEVSLPLGRYQLIKVLNLHNGIVVALCLDPGSNQQVVCKTATGLQPSDTLVASLKRELELLQKVQASLDAFRATRKK